MKAIVIGGGVVGLSVALRLQARELDVTVIDAEAGDSRAASYGNAGHIAIEQVEPLASMDMVRSAARRLFINGGPLSLPPQAFAQWLPFSLRLVNAARPELFSRGKTVLKALIGEAMPAWQRLVVDLGAQDLLREDGHYVAWESAQTAEAGLAAWQAMDTGTARFHSVSDAELQGLNALTRKPVSGAIRFENTGQVADTGRLLRAMKNALVTRGGEIINDRVLKLSRENGRAVIERANADALSADVVIVSSGIGSKPLMQSLGLKVPMIAERGYHIQSSRHGWPTAMPPVVFEDRSMIVTNFETGLRAASFVELSRPDMPADPRKWQRLRKHVSELGLPFGDIEASAQWIGARPTLPDYLPAIGRVRDIGNLYYAFGHQHLGLTLGPVTGEIVARMVGGLEAPKAFDLNRFS